MRIITYSDLHLEFGNIFNPPEADLMILAGDIITFNDFSPLSEFLRKWEKPVLYVLGNHEYYTKRPMKECFEEFKAYLKKNHPLVFVLENEAIALGNIHFFGGTMWTSFENNLAAMGEAFLKMNDYRYIKKTRTLLAPVDTKRFHNIFVRKLVQWLKVDLKGQRVVITHHSPVIKKDSRYPVSLLTPSFCSLDMMPLIEKYQPDLWIYGHTHECDEQFIGKTRIISNQRGYPGEITGFCELGKLSEL